MATKRNNEKGPQFKSSSLTADTSQTELMLALRQMILAPYLWPKFMLEFVFSAFKLAVSYTVSLSVTPSHYFIGKDNLKIGVTVMSLTILNSKLIPRKVLIYRDADSI